MRSLVKLFLLLVPAALIAQGTYRLAGDDPGPWPRLLQSIGLMQATGPAQIYIVRGATADTYPQWLSRAESGAVVVLEGESPLAERFGFVPEGKPTPVRNLQDRQSPELLIVWQHEQPIRTFRLPAGATVHAHDRWTQRPLLASARFGQGAVLWLATTPGEQGYERYPFLPHVLNDLGVHSAFRSQRLWAFLDSSYRRRVDLDYFADRWQAAGISTLHLAAWHFYDADPELDAWLTRLLAACHRRGIQVYAWLELPHVSERFWHEHPAWREQTAAGQDAHLDWRYLMSLQHPECKRAVAAGIRRLLEAHDWDGVNLAELYFESLEGADNPARFTPFHPAVRERFRQQHGIDPQDALKDPAMLKTFLTFRNQLAQEMQEEWLAELDRIRQTKPHLDVVLTHVDDRYDTRMRDLIGADAARVLPLQRQRAFTFLVEDPATIWHLGPDRYPQIAAKYQPIATQPERLAVDINVVERYQDVYPTKVQTGAELFQLVHLAASSFARVALYMESSIHPRDLPLLPAALAAPTRAERLDNRVVVDSKHGLSVAWTGPALVDGQPWPLQDAAWLHLPPGAHVVEPGTAQPALRVLHYNIGLKTALATKSGLELAYDTDGRGWLTLNERPAALAVDSAPFPIRCIAGDAPCTLALPRGQHLVAIER